MGNINTAAATKSVVDTVNVDVVTRDFFLCRPARGKGNVPRPQDDVFVGYPPEDRLGDLVQSHLSERVAFSKRLGNLDERVKAKKVELLAALHRQLRPADVEDDPCK